MAEAISWARRWCLCTVRASTFSAISTKQVKVPWPSSANRWTTQPTVLNDFQAPIFWRPSEAHCPTRPPWTTSSCLMGWPCDKKKWMVVPVALRVVCLKQTRKLACLGHLAHEVGGKYQAVTATLEGKRKDKAKLHSRRKSSSRSYGNRQKKREEDWQIHRDPQDSWTPVLSPTKLLIP